MTSGNLQTWDYLGNYKWLLFSASAASPSIITSAHGYSLADVVVVSTKLGGTLPTLSGGSFNPTRLVAATVATDTFTLTTSGSTALNASTVAVQPIAVNVPSATDWVTDSLAYFRSKGHSWCYHSWREWWGWDAEIDQSVAVSLNNSGGTNPFPPPRNPNALTISAVKHYFALP